MFIGDFQADRAVFQQKLQKVIEARRDNTVYLKADKMIPYGVVVQIMSDIRAAGVEKLGMVTLPVNENDKRSG